jgi:hypothetical protein
MPRRRVQKQHWDASRRAISATRMTRHAEALAEIAGILADRQGGLMEGAMLVIQRMAPPAGLSIWEAALGQELLRVDSTGRIMFYQAGSWEQRLITLIEGT